MEEYWSHPVPDLLFLRDNDGDDKADERYVILQGLGIHLIPTTPPTI